MTTALSITSYQKMVDEWVRTIGVRYFSELTNLAQLVEEVGEVARIMSRVFGDQSFKRSADDVARSGEPFDGPFPDPKDTLADELADVMFVLVCIANQTGVDLTDALCKNLEKKTRRDENRHRNNPKLRKSFTSDL
ncbi:MULTISPECIES: nucleotide pyrophosphohydrolase [Desulfococcus]|jgi:NTP pyrophosphatase (non-canonical NTP hydrolase)|uniref:MazG nucleotide pyrophosphohydrolase n=1 Tax=Desulfococcus multivorans DSM 2059 TaxID=1121405 RepID=S7UZK6_DESML|nr:nucleotide pyrophosphohydrolase [Desulfococcus multivorans]AOY59650.1 MazG: nucleotide pyrophosphohydrolase [Desulfococcus multivorans]EPR37863.1 MazG nucleotide pyrophosphohydrolase [Desulfococcus multivorans DSM 2059]MDX9819800.1 nucleotide pyrophosphohydrolase [Desulfococcus multivorans]SKA16448.1 NTP pyrophosphatase, house-cleaning of non-canonical NTPs [Desulfococcus multivorans DSM 2059]